MRISPRYWISMCCVATGCSGSGEAGPSCAPDSRDPIRVGTLALPSSELSGLAASHTLTGQLWTQDDSGDSDIFAIDSNAGMHGVLDLDGADAVDWEDIATGPCGAAKCIFVADTGDNDLTRQTVSILEVSEPTSSVVGTIKTAFRRYVVRYPDGPHNVEALVIDSRDGKAYGITKVDSGDAQVFEFPLTESQTATAVQIGTFSPPSGDGRVTAADLIVDDCAVKLAIRTHDRLFELRGEPETAIADLLGAKAHELNVADEDQGESVAYAADGSAYFTVSEGASPPLWRVGFQ